MALSSGTSDPIGPADLTAARIRRANPSIYKEAARELAAELHHIVACVRERCAAAKPSRDFDVNDFVQTITRNIIDDRSPRDGAAANDGIWVMEWLTELGGYELYLRYMRLFDRINGTDMVGEFELDGPPPKKPELCLVRDDLPPLEALKQAVIAAVRLAQKGEGSNEIFEHVHALRDATGLNFIMEATEAHRKALFDLVQNAGIPMRS
jgi:hypothetical protein